MPDEDDSAWQTVCYLVVPFVFVGLLFLALWLLDRFALPYLEKVLLR